VDHPLREFDMMGKRSYDNHPVRLSTLGPRVPDSIQEKRRVAA
jgi:hypothetical protein